MNTKASKQSKSFDRNIKKNNPIAIPTNQNKHKVSNSTQPKKDYSNYLWCLGVLLLVILVFKPVLNYDFVNWDDDRYVTDNPFLKNLSWANTLIYFKQFYFLMYLPLTMVTYVFDTWMAGGIKPFYFHLSNLLLHLFNTAMVFIVVLKLEFLLRGKKNWIMPTITAALFGLVTSHVESVAWIAERKDVLYTAFLLISFYSYLKYHESSKKIFYFFSLLTFIFSLVSKAQAFPFAFILFFLDALLVQTYFNKKRWLEKIPFIIIGLFFAILAILGNKSDPEGFQKLDYSLIERLSFACYGYITYIVKLFLPYNLAIIHPYPDRVNGSVPMVYWFYTIPVLAVIYAFILAVKRNFRIAFGIAFFTFSIVIILQLFAYHNFIMAERYSYFSSIGIFYILSYGVYEWILRKPAFKIPILSVISVFVLIMCFLSASRLSVWENSSTLWDDELLKYPKVLIAHYNQGNYKADKGDLNGAIICYNRALNLNPDYIPALSNKGVTEGKLNQPKEALRDFEHVAKIDGTYKNVFSNIGNVKVMLGDMQGAIKDYSKALEILNDFPDALYNRGQAYSTIGNTQAALADFDKLIKLQSNYPLSHYARGMALLNLRKYNEALVDFQFELQISSGNVEALYAKGMAHLGLNQYDDAIQCNSLVLKSNPNLALPYYQRALAIIAKGKASDACNDLKQALRLGFQPAAVDLQKNCK